MYIRAKVTFKRNFVFTKSKNEFAMGLFIGNLTRINAMQKIYCLRYPLRKLQRNPPQLLWRTSKNGTHLKLLTTFTLSILLIMNNHIYILYSHISMHLMHSIIRIFKYIRASVFCSNGIQIRKKISVSSKYLN